MKMIISGEKLHYQEPLVYWLKSYLSISNKFVLTLKVVRHCILEMM